MPKPLPENAGERQPNPARQSQRLSTSSETSRLPDGMLTCSAGLLVKQTFIFRPYIHHSLPLVSTPTPFRISGAAST